MWPVPFSKLLEFLHFRRQNVPGMSELLTRFNVVWVVLGVQVAEQRTVHCAQRRWLILPRRMVDVQIVLLAILSNCESELRQVQVQLLRVDILRRPVLRFDRKPFREETGVRFCDLFCVGIPHLVHKRRSADVFDIQEP